MEKELRTSIKLNQAATLLDVVNLINEAPSAEEMNDMEFTAEQLAGQYAFEAADEAGYGFNDPELEVHLDILEEEGAKFDLSGAILHSKVLAAAIK